MAQTLADYDIEYDISKAVQNLVTEDDEPVDNPFSEKQQRLLTDALYSSWTPPKDEEHPDGARTFWAAANVGIFPSIHQPPLAPDVFLSVDVNAPENWHENRAYFMWEYGKAPEVVIEIVSNRKGGELGNKKLHYVRMGVQYYIVFDPKRRLSDEVLQCFVSFGGKFVLMDEAYFPEMELKLTLWHGAFERKEDTFLRWCDGSGELLLTGNERAEKATARADKMAAKLRELGIEPEQL